LKKNRLFYNGLFYIQAGNNMVVDSMAIAGKRITAVGNGLEKDADFKTCERINLRGRTVIPGFTDSHTHFYFFAMSLGSVKLDGLDSIEETLAEVKRHVSGLSGNEWVTGDGFSL